MAIRLLLLLLSMLGQRGQGRRQQLPAAASPVVLRLLQGGQGTSLGVGRDLPRPGWGGVGGRDETVVLQGLHGLSREGALEGGAHCRHRVEHVGAALMEARIDLAVRVDDVAELVDPAALGIGGGGSGGDLQAAKGGRGWVSEPGRIRRQQE